MLRFTRPLAVFIALVVVIAIHHHLVAAPADDDHGDHGAAAHRYPSSGHGEARPLAAHAAGRAKLAGGAKSAGSGALDERDIDDRGLLAWDERGRRHPIELLIERAKRQAAQIENNINEVESLDDAVEEYERAYKMRPPPGFDKWYAFTRSGEKPRSIPVAPLYSMAHDTILPFLSHPAALLRERLEEQLAQPDSIFILTFVPDGQGDKGTACSPGQSWTPADWESRGKGRVKVKGPEEWSWRCNNTLEFLLPILHQLPDEIFHQDPPFEIAWSTDDAAHGMSHHSFVERSKNLARAGREWTDSQLYAAEQAMRWTHGWSWACPENSPLRASANDLVLNDIEHDATASAPRSFVGDFQRAVDICENPQNMGLHVTTIVLGHASAGPLKPVFGMCRTARNTDIGAVPLDGVWDEVAHVPWEQKTRNELFWRGSTTGVVHSKKIPWRQSQRERLHFLAHNSTDAQVDLLVDRTRQGGALEVEKWSQARLNEAYLDVGLAGRPSQCEVEDGTCEDMAREIKFMDVVAAKDALSYKYVIDVDGNGWSSRFRRLLMGNNVVLKSTQYPEWFNDILIPWYHYVPVKLDYSDVYDIMAFFNGAPDGSTAGRDDLAKEIAANGYRFVQEKFRIQDMQSYTFLLILEWWRATSDDREKASYQS